MDPKQQECQVAYRPLPRGFIKEELEDQNLEGNQDESNEQGGKLVAYRPLSHGVIKEELQSGDEYDEFNFGIQDNPVVSSPTPKEEPVSDGDDDDGCELVAYLPLPHGVVKSELESGDDQNNFHSGIQVASVHSSTSAISEHPSFKEVDSLGDVPIDDEFDPSPPIAGPSLRKKKGTGIKSLANINHPKEKGNEFASGNSTLSKKKRGGKSLSLALSLAEEKERPYRCDTCGRCYKEKHHLKRHLMGGECGIDVQFSCKQCGDHFARKDNLESIQKVERSQLAAFGEEFINSTKAGHPEEYPYKCSKCENVYKRKDYMTRHLKYECGVKPIPCKDCNQQFKHKRTLKRHLLHFHKADLSKLLSYEIAPSVRPVQPFKCERCGRTYKTKKILVHHITHVCGQDPSFSCTQCSFKAKRKSILDNHAIKVHRLGPA